MADPSEHEIVEALLGAHREKIAAPAPEAELVERPGRPPFEQSRLRAARSWLFALGYLDDDEDLPDYDDALEEAVKVFQGEAGLEVDGWIGTEETWPRLRQLITFDDPLDADYWIVGDTPRPAMVRAARVRLWLYRFGNKKNLLDRAALEIQTRAFIETLERLGLPEGSAPAHGPARLAFVLSHDDHVALLARPEAEARFRAITHRERMIAAHDLLLNLTKVELWLAQTGSVDLIEQHHETLAHGRIKVPKELRDGMREFMDALDRDEPAVGNQRGDFIDAMREKDSVLAIRLFLDATVRFTRDDDALAPERVEQLQDFYNKNPAHSQARADATATEMQGINIRSRLWDGLKRAFFWVRKAIATAIKSLEPLLDLAKKLARYAYRVASEAVSGVFRAAKSFTDHLATAFGRHHRDEAGHIVLVRSFGRDTDLLVSAAAPPGYAAAYTRRLHVSAQIFRWACRILGTVIGFVRRAALGALTGAALLRALVFAASEAAGIREAVARIGRLKGEFDALTALIAPEEKPTA